jgi:hypothetical protein
MPYSIRSERLLMEEIDYSVLFRWFVGMNMDEEVWNCLYQEPRPFAGGQGGAKVLVGGSEAGEGEGTDLDEHFSVAGTLVEAWASLKSFQTKDQQDPMPPDDPGNPTVNFHGEKRSNQTHESTTDPDARLARKGAGKEAKLSDQDNLLVENRNGLIVDTETWEATWKAERDAALAMLERRPGNQEVTVGADKAYDTADFVVECRNVLATPHVAQNEKRPGGAPLAGARRGMPVTRSVSGSESKSVSAGRRRSH